MQILFIYFFYMRICSAACRSADSAEQSTIVDLIFSYFHTQSLSSSRIEQFLRQATEHKIRFGEKYSFCARWCAMYMRERESEQSVSLINLNRQSNSWLQTQLHTTIQMLCAECYVQSRTKLSEWYNEEKAQQQ